MQPTFSKHILGDLILGNRIVMAPMNRNRALNNQPNALMTEYYAQRSNAGLIITEGTSPSPNGLGHARMPGIYTKSQIQAWRQITNAIHENGGKVFLQLMHTGRVGHTHNLPSGARVLAPSALAATGQVWTDKQGWVEYAVPQEMTAEDIETTKYEFTEAAVNAMTAGFDGVELHAGGGYLFEQFLSPKTNRRNDLYGGSIENRSRFLLEVIDSMSEAIGKDQIGVLLSPYSITNDIAVHEGVDQTYKYLAQQLNELGVVYLHLQDHSSLGESSMPSTLKQAIREEFHRTIIFTGGHDLKKAEQDIAHGFTDLVGFDKLYVNNPDLATRLRKNYPLNSILDFSTLYTSGERGYTNYPMYDEELISA
jgi:N-ethylmaleimide reductase